MPQEDEQSQSLVVAGNLGELVPQEEVVDLIRALTTSLLKSKASILK